MKTLPDELASDGRTLLRELEKSGEIADEQIVISSVQKLIEQAVRSLLGASYHTHTHTHTHYCPMHYPTTKTRFLHRRSSPANSAKQHN